MFFPRTGKSCVAARLSLLFILILYKFCRCSSQMSFCHDGTKKGRRLNNVTKLRSTFSMSSIDCVFWCVHDDCCRSANYKKDSYTKENCELLHPTDEELTKNIVNDSAYDYLILHHPYRKFSCSCTPCMYASTALPECSCQGSALFPDQNISHYIASEGAPDMTAITVCLWANTTRDDINTHYVSYAVKSPDNFNEFYIAHDKSGDVILGINVKNSNRQKATSSVKNITDGQWHSLCASWTSNDGAYFTYKDGVVESSGTNLKSGETIRGGGIWVLGQEQDSYGGGFQIDQMLVGEIAEVNIWDRVLSQDEIAMFSCYCSPTLKGNVKTWGDFKKELNSNSTVKIIDNPNCCSLN